MAAVLDSERAVLVSLAEAVLAAHADRRDAAAWRAVHAALFVGQLTWSAGTCDRVARRAVELYLHETARAVLTVDEIAAGAVDAVLAELMAHSPVPAGCA